MKLLLICIIKICIFNVLIDSSFLNMFSSLLPDLLQILERTNVLSKMYGISGFFNFVYLLHLIQYIFSRSHTHKQLKLFLWYFLVTENVEVLFYLLLNKLLGENKLVKSVNPLLLNIKLINPIQNYPHFIELYACIP